MEIGGKYLYVLFLIILLLAGAVFLKNRPDLRDKNSPGVSFSLEQKVGQLFIIGFDGLEAGEDVKNLVKNLHPGGILLLGKNIENETQLKKLIKSLQEIAMTDTGIPLFVAVDQEGGEVSRIKWLQEKAQKDIKNREDAAIIAENRAKKLKDLGVNLNFSPLADESFPGDFIYSRSFQSNAGQITDLAGGMIEGHKKGGIITSLKHFPGYGGISFNPEEKLAFLEKVQQISQFETVPRAEMLMVSNAVYKNIDENLPFSFSENAIDYLKKSLGEDQLIISDDISQNSLIESFGFEDIVSLPINAGVDILIFSDWREPSETGVLALIKSVREGKVAQEKIDAAFNRILKFKKGYFNVEIKNNNGGETDQENF